MDERGRYLVSYWLNTTENVKHLNLEGFITIKKRIISWQRSYYKDIYLYYNMCKTSSSETVA